jgi:hypothetical protein
LYGDIDISVVTPLCHTITSYTLSISYCGDNIKLLWFTSHLSEVHDWNFLSIKITAIVSGCSVIKYKPLTCLKGDEEPLNGLVNKF